MRVHTGVMAIDPRTVRPPGVRFCQACGRRHEEPVDESCRFCGGPLGPDPPLNTAAARYQDPPTFAERLDRIFGGGDTGLADSLLALFAVFVGLFLLLWAVLALGGLLAVLALLALCVVLAVAWRRRQKA